VLKSACRDSLRGNFAGVLESDVGFSEPDPTLPFQALLISLYITTYG